MKNLSPNMFFVGSDAQEYKALSESIINSNLFSIDGLHYEIFRAPGYPLFLAITKSILHTYWLSILFQFLCSFGIAIIIYKICTKFITKKESIIPVLLFIIEPSIFIYSLTIASDILFSFLFTLFIYIYFFKQVNYKNSLISGLLLGYASLTRPISLYFIVPAIIFYFILKKDEFNIKILMKNAVIFIFSSMIILSPWFIRNYKIFHKFTLSSLPSYNLYHYNLPEFYSFRDKVSTDEVRNDFRSELGFIIENDDYLRRGEFIDVLNGINSRHIREDFFEYTGFHLIKTVPFFISSSIKNAIVIKNDIMKVNDSPIKYHNISSIVMSGNLKELFSVIKDELFIFIERILWGIITIISILPLILNYKDDKNWKYYLLFIFIIFYFAILTGPVSYVRYRIPVEPFIFIMFIIGILSIKKKFTKLLV